MVFILRNFAPAGPHESRGADGSPIIWTYRTSTDADAAVRASDYFLDAEGLITSGDVVLTETTDGVSQLVLGRAAGPPVVVTTAIFTATVVIP